MSGRSIASQQLWQTVHSGRERRGCEGGGRLTRKTEAAAGVTPVLPRESGRGRLDSNQRPPATKTQTGNRENRPEFFRPEKSKS